MESTSMPLELDSSHLGGEVMVIVPKVLGDDRGFFMETYRYDNFKRHGVADRVGTRQSLPLLEGSSSRTPFPVGSAYE